MTDPRPWPNNAKEARDRAAEDTQSASFILEWIVDYIDEKPRLSQEEATVVGFKVARALNYCHNALRHLEGVDAQTRPR